MKRSILTLVVAFFFVSNLVGQESTNDALNPSWNHAENRHELKFFIGFGPLLDEKHSDLWESMSSYYPGEDYVANSKTRSIGCLSLKYSYDFFDWINVGMEVSYQRDYKDYKFKQYSDSTFEVIANYYATRTINNILIMPSFEFKYLNKKFIQLYGKVSIGIGLLNHEDEFSLEEENHVYKSSWGTLFMAQLCPVGLRVGKKYAGFVEVGLGMQGLFNVGFSAKF